MLYFSKEEIETLMNRSGGWESVEELLNRLKPYWDSADVKDLYDDEYNKRIQNHSVKLTGKEYVGGLIAKVNIYNYYTYRYLENKKWSGYETILEIGCNDGAFALYLAEKINVKKIVGIDFNEECIRKANTAVSQENLSVSFHCIDANEYRSEDKFDIVILNDVVEHLSDREMKKLMISISSLIKEDGEVLIHTPNGMAGCCKTDYSLVLDFINKWHSRGYFKTVDQLYSEQVHINVKSFRKWRTLFKNVGFKSKVFYDEKWIIPFGAIPTNMLIVLKKYKSV